MTYLAIDSNLKTQEIATFEGKSQVDLLGQILIELRVITHLLSESTLNMPDSVEAIRINEEVT